MNDYSCSAGIYAQYFSLIHGLKELQMVHLNKYFHAHPYCIQSYMHIHSYHTTQQIVKVQRLRIENHPMIHKNLCWKPTLHQSENNTMKQFVPCTSNLHSCIWTFFINLFLCVLLTYTNLTSLWKYGIRLFFIKFH